MFINSPAAVSELGFNIYFIIAQWFQISAGTSEDKTRLFIINLICGTQMSEVWAVSHFIQFIVQLILKECSSNN